MFLDSTFSVLRFGVVLSLLVFVHELGHFLAAKWRKVAVEEFGFGLPPRLWGKEFRGTLYSINLFPIGGFVKLKGEDPEVAGFGDADSFSAKSKRSRAAMIVAGVFGNLLLAWLIFSFLFAVGSPEISGKVQIEEVAKGSPAESAGLSSGDVVVAINDRPVKMPEDLILEVSRQAGREVTLRIDRQGQALQMLVAPRVDPPAGEGPLGVKVILVDHKVTLIKHPLWQAPFYAAVETGQILKEMLGGMGFLVRSALSRQEVPGGVSGVVGIKALTDIAAAMGERFFLQFVAILSLNLLIFNLLPIPALDGGRLLFVGLEAVLRKKLNPKVERVANNLGLAFLLLLFVLITIQDIERFW